MLLVTEGKKKVGHVTVKGRTKTTPPSALSFTEKLYEQATSDAHARSVTRRDASLVSGGGKRKSAIFGACARPLTLSRPSQGLSGHSARELSKFRLAIYSPVYIPPIGSAVLSNKVTGNRPLTFL